MQTKKTYDPFVYRRTTDRVALLLQEITDNFDEYEIDDVELRYSLLRAYMRASTLNELLQANLLVMPEAGVLIEALDKECDWWYRERERIRGMRWRESWVLFYEEEERATKRFLKKEAKENVRREKSKKKK